MGFSLPTAGAAVIGRAEILRIEGGLGEVGIASNITMSSLLAIVWFCQRASMVFNGNAAIILQSPRR